MGAGDGPKSPAFSGRGKGRNRPAPAAACPGMDRILTGKNPDGGAAVLSKATDLPPDSGTCAGADPVVYFGKTTKGSETE